MDRRRRITNSPESGESDVTDEFVFSPRPPPSIPLPIYRHATTARGEDCPDRVLAKIFVFYQRDWARVLLSGVKGRNYHPGMRPLLRLTSVSRRFRKVAINTPELWSLVYVDFTSPSHNVHLHDRLAHMLPFARDTRLTLCFQEINQSAYNQPWFTSLRQHLAPRFGQWTRLVASFAGKDDLTVFLTRWPLATAPNMVDLQLCGPLENSPLFVPSQSFLTHNQALKNIELRNVAWVHREIIPTVSSLSIGPSTDLVLGPSTLRNTFQSFPDIQRLRVLAFETPEIANAEPLLDRFRLRNVVHLTVSPILLRTSMQGFKNGRVLPALMSVSVHFPRQDDDEDDELEETTRQNDLDTVGDFLQGYQVEVLKLKRLHSEHTPSALCNSLFRTMKTSKLREVHLVDCAVHTTGHIRVMLTRATLSQEVPRAALQRRGPPISCRNSNEGAIFLLPSLQQLYVYKCRDVDVQEVAEYVQSAPRSLKEVVVRRCRDNTDDREFYPCGASFDIPVNVGKSEERKLKADHTMTASIDVPAPADFHVHLRQGSFCELVTPHIRQGGFNVAYVMPNLSPPIVNTEQALAYKRELERIEPGIQFLMTLYLSPELTPQEIQRAKKAGIIGVKSYPRGVTTNSEGGIESYTAYYDVFEAMEKEGMVLNLHGEIPSDPGSNVCVLNAERKFLNHLVTLHERFPRLRIVLEHATTREAVESVKSLGDTVACTITAHHLALTVDDWAGQSFNFCKPVAKYPDDREALRQVVREGHPRFFLGSDSAPHPPIKKSTSLPNQPCAAGVYTAPILLPLVAHLLESFDALDKLVGFVSTNGRRFYGLETGGDLKITKLRRNPFRVAEVLVLNEDNVVPFWAGKELSWSLS